MAGMVSSDRQGRSQRAVRGERTPAGAWILWLYVVLVFGGLFGGCAYVWWVAASH